MSLDQNLFTLVFTPHKDNNNVVDLVDPTGTVHYRKQRIPGAEYKIEIYGMRFCIVCKSKIFSLARSNVRITSCRRNGSRCHWQGQIVGAVQSYISC